MAGGCDERIKRYHGRRGCGRRGCRRTRVGHTYDVSNGGLLAIPTGLLGANLLTTINLQGGGTLDVGTQLVAINLADSLTLSGDGNAIIFQSAANLNGLDLATTGFGSTDSIGLSGADTISQQSYNPITGVLTLATASAGDVTVTLPPGLIAGDFQLIQTASGSTVTYIACFARGTWIATEDGEIAVEALRPGTIVRLARGGTAPVRWIGHRRMQPRLADAPETVQPVVVARGALGDGLPRRALRLSPEHALLIDDVLVPVRLLVNGRTIVQEDVERVEYFHVELDRHDAILAEGAAAETYVDTGNRSMFANAPIVDLRPVFGMPDESSVALCAPILLDRELAAPIRVRIEAIADRLEEEREDGRAAMG